MVAYGDRNKEIHLAKTPPYCMSGTSVPIYQVYILTCMVYVTAVV